MIDLDKLTPLIEKQALEFQKNYIGPFPKLENELVLQSEPVLLGCDKFMQAEEPIRISPHPWWMKPPERNGSALNYHYHDFFEIVYAYRGSFLHRIGPDGTQLHQPQGSLVMLNLSTSHILEAQSDDCRAFNIMLRRTLVERNFLQLLYDNQLFLRFFMDAIYSHNPRRDYFLFECDQELSELMDDIVMKYYLTESFVFQELVAKILYMFVKLGRMHQEQEDKKNFSKKSKAESIILYIQKNYATVTMEELQQEFHYSRRQLSRIITNQTGESFTDYVMKLKMDSAVHFAQNTDMPLVKIVELVGYHDTQYFCRMFKRKKGVSFASYTSGHGDE